MCKERPLDQMRIHENQQPFGNLLRGTKIAWPRQDTNCPRRRRAEPHFASR